MSEQETAKWRVDWPADVYMSPHWEWPDFIAPDGEHFSDLDTIAQKLDDLNQLQAENERLKQESHGWHGVARDYEARAEAAESRLAEAGADHLPQMSALAGEIASLRDAERTLKTKLAEAEADAERLADHLSDARSRCGCEDNACIACSEDAKALEAHQQRKAEQP